MEQKERVKKAKKNRKKTCTRDEKIISNAYLYHSENHQFY